MYGIHIDASSVTQFIYTGAMLKLCIYIIYGHTHTHTQVIWDLVSAVHDIYIYIYIHTYTYTYMYMYVYVFVNETDIQ